MPITKKMQECGNRWINDFYEVLHFNVSKKKKVLQQRQTLKSNVSGCLYESKQINVIIRRILYINKCKLKDSLLLCYHVAPTGVLDVRFLILVSDTKEVSDWLLLGHKYNYRNLKCWLIIFWVYIQCCINKKNP